MIRKFLVSGAAALAALMTLTGCSLSVSESQVEEAIRTNLGPQLPGEIEEVDCPDDLKGEVGQSMQCTMTMAGQQITVEVTVTSVDGSNVNFDINTV